VILPWILNAQQAGLPDRKERAQTLLQELVGPKIGYEVLPLAVANEITNFPKEWHRTWEGYGKRAASQYGQFVILKTLEYSFAEIHHEDLRYVPSSHSGVWRRAVDSIGHTFVVPSTNSGSRTLALAPIVSSYATWAIATQWYPERLHTPGNVFLYGSLNMAGMIGANVFREFWPGLRRKYFHRK
jgi:hypothetical protein